MTRLQDDLLEIYNSLVIFSASTLKQGNPIKVWFEKDSRFLVLEQKGVSVRLYNAIYYCLNLESIQKPTYLLPDGYDYLMSTLKDLINSGVLLKDRTCLSPIPYGFDIYATNLKELWKGPDLLGRVRFVSGNGWLFRLVNKRKYDL